MEKNNDFVEYKKIEKPTSELKGKDFIPIYGGFNYLYRNRNLKRNLLLDVDKKIFQNTIMLTLYNGLFITYSWTGLEQLLK